MGSVREVKSAIFTTCTHHAVTCQQLDWSLYILVNDTHVQQHPHWNIKGYTLNKAYKCIQEREREIEREGGREREIWCKDYLIFRDVRKIQTKTTFCIQIKCTNILSIWDVWHLYSIPLTTANNVLAAWQLAPSDCLLHTSVKKLSFTTKGLTLPVQRNVIFLCGAFYNHTSALLLNIRVM